MLALNDGATYCSNSLISNFPLCVVTSFTLITSIGTAEFTTVLLVFLDPTTTTSFKTCPPLSSKVMAKLLSDADFSIVEYPT
ncbi:hypothetical protein D3C87_1921050 [compost metagenome]